MTEESLKRRDNLSTLYLLAASFAVGIDFVPIG